MVEPNYDWSNLWERNYHKSQFAHGFWTILLANSSFCAQKTKQIASVYGRKRLESASDQYNGKKFILVRKIYSGIFKRLDRKLPIGITIFVIATAA